MALSNIKLGTDGDLEVKGRVEIGSGNTVTGTYAMAQGSGTKASGYYSHAEGFNTIASGGVSHAEGEGTTASGRTSHAEGQYTKAIGEASHAEGEATIANNRAEHASGAYNVSTKGTNQELSALTADTQATLFSIGNGASEATRKNAFEVKYNGDVHITGNTSIGSGNTFTSTDSGGITTNGIYAFAQGSGCTAIGRASHAEGSGCTASGWYSHAEGDNTTASGQSSHAEGSGTIASDWYSHAEGSGTIASDWYSHAEGVLTKASSSASHAEGIRTTASGGGSHAEGESTKAIGVDSHAEGEYTVASGRSSHAEGSGTTASGLHSHAEGLFTIASGHYSHAEGSGTTASNYGSHAEGTNTLASGRNSHAEGWNTTASGESSHAEGSGTTANNYGSHAEGLSTKASGWYSHAEGDRTIANGKYSHAEGLYTIANNLAEHASGLYNVSTLGTNQDLTALTTDSQATLFSIGNGATESTRKNAVEVKWNGDAYFSGDTKFAKGITATTITSPTITTINNNIDTKQPIGDYSTKTELSDGLVSKADTVHTHTIDNINDLQLALNNKQDTLVSATNIKTINGNSLLGSGDISISSGGGTIDAYTKAESNALLDGKAATWHFHDFNEINNLQPTLDSKQDNLVSGTSLKTINNESLLGSGNITITSGGGTIDAYTKTEVDDKINNHGHLIGDVNILRTELDDRQLTLISGTNIKTINGNSLLGSGDITISSGGGGTVDAYTKAETDTKLNNKSNTNHNHVIGDVDDLQITINGKQDILVSGTNIKTINGEELLGSGDIVIVADTSDKVAKSGDTMTGQLNIEHNLNVGSGNTFTHTDSAGTVSNGTYAFAQGSGCTASGEYSHAEGWDTTASGTHSHAEGARTTASGHYSHAEGVGTKAIGSYSHAGGEYTNARGKASHVEGRWSTVNNLAEHAIGNWNVSISGVSQEESALTNDSQATLFSIGNGANDDGVVTKKNALEVKWNGDVYIPNRLNIGSGNIVTGVYAMAQGGNCTASGTISHAEGSSTIASGGSSHAEGSNTKAIGRYSHAEGTYTIANNDYEHASGHWNVSNSDTLFSVGNGINHSNRKNALEITDNGDIFFYKDNVRVRLQDLF